MIFVYEFTWSTGSHKGWFFYVPIRSLSYPNRRQIDFFLYFCME